MTQRFERSLDIKNGRVDMTHGSGGRAMAQLIDQLFAKAFDNPALAEGNDQARLAIPAAGRLAFSTDSYVISPLFFAGGDIGSLAVHGTVNDVALSGAKPLWLSAGFILEEGFPLADLERIVTSMAKAAQECGVQIVTGDTKVVEKGKADGVFINTAGVGLIAEGVDLSVHNIRAGDAIIVSGTLGDHGVAVMAQREGLVFDEPVLSDSAALNGLIDNMIKSGVAIHALRDPTRGGLATSLNEMARAAGVGMRLNEAAIPVRASVRGVCEILGLDPLYIANEGKLIAFCPVAQAQTLLTAMKGHEHGREAAIIGEVVEDDHAFVEMTTTLGGQRMVDWLAGEQLPRIC
ncbi:MAG: hydrogenase expression/formation protein HypE [Bdellovibrionales bacterium]|jgi:hydrogenase expression/formation protein HypE